MTNQVKTEQEIQQEMEELNNQFSEFLKTKGIFAKFKVAFGNMAESARKQHAADVAQFQAVKAQSAEDNKEFVQFLHTKGLKAKFLLVVENIKKGIANANANTSAQIAKVKAQTQANIRKATAANQAPISCTAESLADEFNAFLKSKGLDGQYSVVITENK